MSRLTSETLLSFAAPSNEASRRSSAAFLMEPTFLGLEDGLGALDGGPFFVGMLVIGDRKNKLMRGTKRINYLPKLQACTTTNVKAAGTDRNLLLFQLYTDLDSNFFIGKLKPLECRHFSTGPMELLISPSTGPPELPEESVCERFAGA